ncbi:MAG: GGDEF domain-containing protein [Acetobacteraceae bacterium]|nr:GGDEF domain-containing protein [Acetobacteraceae bacterium]
MMRTTDPPADEADQLSQVLLESRRRWRDFGALAADIAFEVDAEGLLNFIAPDDVLGMPAESLLGQRAAAIFFPHEDTERDPFLASFGIRQRRSWISDADRQKVCLSVSSAPILDEVGRCVGARAVALDVTVREQKEISAAASIRRAEMMDHILDQMRLETYAPRIMASMLATAVRALGGSGAAVLNLGEGAEDEPVLHDTGEPCHELVPELLPLLRASSRTAPFQLTLNSGFSVLVCLGSTRFGLQSALIVWRPLRERAWDSDDHLLLGAVTTLVRVVLEHEAIQRELASQARTDPLTGLLNRRAFIDEAQRRIDRLEREGLPGTLMFVDLDRLKPLNDRLGHEAGDAALVLTSAVLRRMVRPADLVARLGGDEFALWLDGFDGLTAAERAEHLRLSFPRDAAEFAAPGQPGLTMSIGIACRQPGEGEELDDIIQRADLAMYEVKRNGGGHWRVSNPERPA